MSNTRKGKNPAFLFYAGDWLADARVRLLRLDERGAYIDLLAVQWREGSIPDDERQAGLLVGLGLYDWDEWPRIWNAISEFFVPDGDGGRRNPKLEGIRCDLDAKAMLRSAKARKAAKKRWSEAHANKGDECVSNAQAMLGQCHAVAVADTTTPNGDTNVSPAEPTVEKWNDRLAPLCRRAGGEKHIGRWLADCKRLIALGVSVDELEARVGGLCELRDRGMVEWIEKGEPMTPAVFERFPDLRQQAVNAWNKYGPDNSPRLEVVV